MYKNKAGLVNGEIVGDLLEICNAHFINPFIQPYAGANFECKYCGSLENTRGRREDHSPDCPVTVYREVAEKHKQFIVSA